MPSTSFGTRRSFTDEVEKCWHPVFESTDAVVLRAGFDLPGQRTSVGTANAAFVERTLKARNSLTDSKKL